MNQSALFLQYSNLELKNGKAKVINQNSAGFKCIRICQPIRVLKNAGAQCACQEAQTTGGKKEKTEKRYISESEQNR